MLGSFGSVMFGSTEFLFEPLVGVGGNIALLGDSSSHGGIITMANQDGTFDVGGVDVAVDGASHSCPLDGHGVTVITAATVKSYHNGKLILTENAVAGCGAVITPSSRGSKRNSVEPNITEPKLPSISQSRHTLRLN